MNFNILGDFQKNKYFWGYEDFVDISLGSSQKWIIVTRGGSICNENPAFITPSTNTSGFYTICKTKDQSVSVIMVNETLFIFPNIISYRLFKKHTYINCIYFSQNCKDLY